MSCQETVRTTSCAERLEWQWDYGSLEQLVCPLIIEAYA